jgi:hypothetical protein
MDESQPDPLAIASVVLGFLSLIFTCCSSVLFAGLSVVVLPFSIGGAACGVMSLRRIQASPERYSGKPFAIVGIMLNVMLTLLIGLMLLMITLLLGGVIAVPLLEELLQG